MIFFSGRRRSSDTHIEHHYLVAHHAIAVTWLQCPRASTSGSNPASPRDDIVVTVIGDGTVRLNQETIAIADLDERLKTVYKNAANHIIFVRGNKELDFHHVADIYALARERFRWCPVRVSRAGGRLGSTKRSIISSYSVIVAAVPGSPSLFCFCFKSTGLPWREFRMFLPFIIEETSALALAFLGTLAPCAI